MTENFTRSASRVVICAVLLPAFAARAQMQAPAPTKIAASKTVPIAAPAYRAVLQKTLDQLKSPRPAAVAKIVGKLDVKYAVRRADGQIQTVSGNFWSNFGATSFGATSGQSRVASSAQIRRARGQLQRQIRALDEWTKTPVYQAADAQKIIAGLEASGQIRVGPLWWQKMMADAWSAVAKAWKGFWDWFTGLFPKAPPLQNTAAPSDKWLWVLFYGVVTAILGLILWLVWRNFGGFGRRATQRAAQLDNEDAELLQLPPDELLSRAARFAAQGNFREALRHRYLSLLLDLDARGVWRYDARRTNWEHIAALSRGASRRELVAPLSDLTKRFDRVRYGGAECDDAGWRLFDADARSFESQAAPLQKIIAQETAREAERAKEMAR